MRRDTARRRIERGEFTRRAFSGGTDHRRRAQFRRHRSVGGVGRYIGYASVQPATVTIPYLTVFDVTTKVESVYNKGTKASPVAGMLLTVNISAQSKIPLVSKKALGYTYTLDGVGNISTVN